MATSILAKYCNKPLILKLRFNFYFNTRLFVENICLVYTVKLSNLMCIKSKSNRIVSKMWTEPNRNLLDLIVYLGSS